MTFFEQVRNLLARAEVDEIDRSTQQMLGHRDETQERRASIAALRSNAADDRHPALSAAVDRRNGARSVVVLDGRKVGQS